MYRCFDCVCASYRQPLSQILYKHNMTDVTGIVVVFCDSPLITCQLLIRRVQIEVVIIHTVTMWTWANSYATWSTWHIIRCHAWLELHRRLLCFWLTWLWVFKHFIFDLISLSGYELDWQLFKVCILSGFYERCFDYTHIGYFRWISYPRSFSLDNLSKFTSVLGVQIGHNNEGIQLDFVWYCMPRVSIMLFGQWTHEILNECFVCLIFLAPCDSYAHETWAAWLYNVNNWMKCCGRGVGSFQLLLIKLS